MATDPLVTASSLPETDAIEDLARRARHLRSHRHRARLPPPLVRPKDPKTGVADYVQIDRHAGARLRNVDFSRSNFDACGNRVTPEGSRWGLSGWWESNWSVDPRGVTTVLGLDDNGLGGAWVKGYGGPPTKPGR